MSKPFSDSMPYRAAEAELKRCLVEEPS